ARRVVKAVFDRAGAAALLVAASPVMAAIALAVCADSAGPVLFRQIRVGRGGRPFVMYKFRTMCVGADRRRGELRHLNDAEAVRLDLRYVDNWSLSLDLVILLRTLTAVARASGAY